VWTMQPEAQTTIRGFLAVSADVIEMADRYSRRLKSGLALGYVLLFDTVQRSRRIESPTMPTISMVEM